MQCCRTINWSLLNQYMRANSHVRCSDHKTNRHLSYIECCVYQKLVRSALNRYDYPNSRVRPMRCVEREHLETRDRAQSMERRVNESGRLEYEDADHSALERISTRRSVMPRKVNFRCENLLIHVCFNF